MIRGAWVALAASAVMLAGPAQATAAHCSSRVYVFGYAAVTQVQGLAVHPPSADLGSTGCAAWDSESVDARYLPPGTSQLRIRYAPAGGSSAGAFTAVVRGLGTSTRVTLRATAWGQLGLATYYDSDFVGVDPLARGTLVVTVEQTGEPAAAYRTLV